MVEYIPKDGRQRRAGFHISYVTAFLLLLVICVMVLLVGLIVGFAHPANIRECHVLGNSEGLAAKCDSPYQENENSATPRNFRLPQSISPVHYNIVVRPNIYTSSPDTFSLSGWVEIYLTCTEPTKTIVLHLKELKTTFIKLKDSEGEDMEISGTEIVPHVDFLKLKTKSFMIPGKSYVLSLNYTGTLANGLQGIYYSSYLSGNETKYMVVSQFSPTNARKAFPCFDEPAIKSTFNISIERQAGYSSMSSMDIIRTETLSDGWFRDIYGMTPQMSTYVLAFIVSNFSCLHVPGASKPIRVCGRREIVDQLQFGASIVGKFQSFYEEYFDIELPLPKLDHVAVPDFAFGGMENWGLIIYSETNFIYNNQSNTPSNTIYTLRIIGHEIAHMWFGDLVTPIWWDDVWLKEGFASYFSTVGINHVLPELNLGELSIQKAFLRVFSIDAVQTSNPVYQNVGTVSDIRRVFNSIAYSKGYIVVSMLHDFLGESTFKRGLQNYLKANAYTGVSYKQLFRYLTLHAIEDGKDMDVTSVMESWILQTGYPVVDMNYDVGSGHVNLTQNRFLYDPSPEVENPTWDIPMTIVTSSDNEREWIEPAKDWLTVRAGMMKVDNNSEWIIGNTRSRYLYRVNYDKRNWKALEEQMRRDHEKIPPASRARILDDAYSFARQGLIDQSVQLALSSYLSGGGETHIIPWKAAFQGIDHLNKMFQPSSHYDLVMKHIQHLLFKTYKNLGWADKEGDSFLLRHLREEILAKACKVEVKDCREHAHRLYLDWMDHEKEIPEPVQNIVFCAGIAMGGAMEWDFALSKYQSSTSNRKKQDLLTGLGCTKNTQILQRLLDLSLEEQVIRRQDFTYTLRAVSVRPGGRALAWNFFKTNWDIIFHRFGNSLFALPNIIKSLTDDLSTEEEIRELSEFISTHSDLGTSQKTFWKAIETAKANLAWREKNGDAIVEWLQENRP